MRYSSKSSKVSGKRTKVTWRNFETTFCMRQKFLIWKIFIQKFFKRIGVHLCNKKNLWYEGNLLWIFILPVFFFVWCNTFILQKYKKKCIDSPWYKGFWFSMWGTKMHVGYQIARIPLVRIKLFWYHLLGVLRKQKQCDWYNLSTTHKQMQDTHVKFM